MFGSHQHPQPKRRKKRPIHSVKTVDVTRGKSGYGFTISGQHPCVLSCIVSSSPAAQVGLRPGDYLISVNSKDVSKLGHDEVVRMVGMSTGTLTVQVAENYNSSDSSDEDYVPRNKLKYPNRAKRGHHRGYVEKMDKLLADINHRDRYCPDGHSHDPNSRPLNANKNEPPRSRSSRPRLHTPVGAENHEIQAQGTSYIEAGASNVFKVPFQKSVSTSNVQTHHRVEPKQAFIKSTSQIHFKSNPSVNGASRVGNIPGHMYDHFSPNSLQQIINHSLHSYSAANEAFILDEFDEDGDEDPLKQDGGEIRIVVGYIGSLEMPGDVTQPHIRIQSIRNSVRRLRLEQKIHTLVLMVVSNNGVKLINIGGKEIANYSIDRLVFCGVCPDDRRFFGIVTLNIYNLDSSSDSDSRDEPASSSCHIFMVDQEMAAHNIHGQKAKYFGIVCSVDPHTQRCMEFPRSTTPIIMSISNLYKDRPGGSLENDVARSKVLSDPNRPVEPDQSSSASSSINSNSDSGLGLFRDDKGVDQALVVDMPPPPAPPPLPVRDRPPAQYPQIKWSGNTVHLTEGPVKVFTPSASDKLISKKSQSPNVLLHDTSTSSEEFIRATGKLNIRAMPDPSPKKEKENDGLEYQNAAENLRKHSQKLLQARRQVMLDQTSSDTESVSSRSDKVPFVLNAKERPVSAPFKYLSDDSNVGLHTSFRNDVMHGKHDFDSSLMDKLSPRAFLSSAFTPVGYVGSAFKKIRSRPILHELRSPSAPPIPSYHGDDEDSEEEAVKGIIKQLHQEKGLGVQVGSNSKKTRKGSKLEASHLMQSIAAVELYRSQIEVAKYLELAYLGVSDHPDVAEEVRLTAHSARTQHMMTTGLMKSFMITSKHIVSTMIPMIFDAVDLEDKDLVRGCFAKIITKAEEMKKGAEDTRQQYYVIQTKVQENFARVNTKNKYVKDEQSRIDIEQEEAQKLAAEHERAAKELEEEKEKMENDIQDMKEYRDKWMKEAETANEAMQKEDDKTFLDAVIVPPNVAGGPAEIAKCVMQMGVNIISRIFGRNKKEKQFKNMMEAYQISQDSVDKVSAEKREVIFKILEQKRAKLERLSKIKKLNVFKASLGDARSLLEASTSLGAVDRQFTRLINFWDNMVVTLQFLKDDTEVGEVYLQKLENPKYAERFKGSISRAENGWNSFDKICGDYVSACENDEKVAIKVLYNFLSVSIEAVPEDEKNMRMSAIVDEIEETIDFDVDEMSY